MKKLFLNAMLLCAPCLINAMEKIKLPSRQVLRDRLQAKGLDYFVEKTRIDQKLGDKEMYSSDVVITVATALHDFDKYIMNAGQSMIPAAMHDQQPEIIKLFLQDHLREVASLIGVCQIKLE
jgi:hypothetical protein